MRALDENETTQVFTKVFKFTGNNLKNLVECPSHEGPDNEPTRYAFRLQKNRVYYVSESLVKRATNIKREKLVAFGNNLENLVVCPSHECPYSEPTRYAFCFSLVKRSTNIKREKLVAFGTQIGKLTKGGSFHLTIHALNLLAANAKHKVWIKPTTEQSFTYGNHVLKGGLGRITESISAGDGVVVFSMNDVPLGFGIAAKSTGDCRKMDPNGIVVLHQADVGMYLREEDDM